MRHRVKLIDADEYDALTKARHHHRFRAGERKMVKRKVNKRMRKIQWDDTVCPSGEYRDPEWL